jgi:hypothetical protein
MFGRMANAFRGLLGLILGVGQPAQATLPAAEAGRPTAEAHRPTAVTVSPPRAAAGGIPTAADGEWPDLLMAGARFDLAPSPGHPLPRIVFAGGDEGDPFSLDLGLSAVGR